MARNCLRPGCSKPAKPKGSYCSDLCRAHAFKLRKQMGGMLPAERKRAADAAVKRARRAQGVIPSDVRLSFERTIRVVARGLVELEFCEEREALYWAEQLLVPALPVSKRPEMVAMPGWCA